MPVPTESSWALQFRKETVDRGYHHGGRTRVVPPPDPSQCRPENQFAIMDCPHPVVREGRCILHTPKYTEREKRLFSKDELDAEALIEEQFKTEFLKQLQQAPGQMLPAIHFPAMQWNQPPLYDLLRANHFTLDMAVFDQATNFSGVVFGKSARFLKTVLRIFH